MSKLIWAGVVAGALGASFAACSAGNPNNQFTGTSSGGSASGGHGGATNTGTASGTGGDVIINTGGTSTGTGGSGGSCAGVTNKAEQLPLDIYLMLDSSGSMADFAGLTFQTKWDAVNQALQGFFADSKSAGVGVGIQHFAIVDPLVPSSCTADAQCAHNGSTCMLKSCINNDPTQGYLLTPCSVDADCSQYGSKCYQLGSCGPFDPTQGNYCFNTTAAGVPNFCQGTGTKCQALTQSFCTSQDTCALVDYATPAVEIAALPGNAGALNGAIGGWSPNGLTPTSAALGGAIQHAQAWAAQNPTHAVVVVLATDGMPTECAPLDIPSIAGLASAGNSGAHPVKTFAIGVFAPTDIFSGAQANLDAIAAAGGTTKSFVVDTTQNVEAQFQAALDAIRGAKLACEFKVPAASGTGSLDYGAVNVKYTPQGKPAQTVGYVGSLANCDPTKGGWYYDVDPTSGATPTKIIMCKKTCDAFSAATGGQVDIEVGCATIIQPPPQ
jgi:hypothetical protein